VLAPPSHAPCEPQSDRTSRSTLMSRQWSLTNVSDQSVSEWTQRFHGSLTALATPFENDGIAEKSFAEFITWQIEQGSCGLVVCGATGESATLTPQERNRLIQIAVEVAEGRIPIIAATGTNCTRETIALTQAAEAAGASAALIVTPYYNKPNQTGVYRHYCEIARSVDIPLIVENDPSRTGIYIQPETLVRLAEIPNIIGIEDTTGDLSGISVNSFSMGLDFIRLSGADDTGILFRMAGGQGSVSVVANIVPRLWAEMQQACSLADWGRATNIQKQLQPLLRALRRETNPAPVKYALSFLRPKFSPKVRLPLVSVSYETGSAIVAALTDLKLID
jgi:4-hydroxy-tetrahydrodipicolinate synthase